MKEHCPTCDSPDPKRHPAMAFEGEVQICKDPWHTPIQDQPPPIPQTTRAPVWSLVIDDVRRMFARDQPMPPPRGTVDEITRFVLDDMIERDRVGRERYGTPLTTHNGRDHLVDAYQEALDLAVYLRAEIEEKGANHVALGVHNIYAGHLLNVMRLRHVIWERDGQR